MASVTSPLPTLRPSLAERAAALFPPPPPRLRLSYYVIPTASTPEREWLPSPSDDVYPNVQTVDFSTILFLDPGLLQHVQVETVRAVPSVPPHILHLLGDFDEIRVTAERFFGHIHRWMPFISKKRFYDLYLRPSFHSHSDVVLLLLAMKLITTFPRDDTNGPRAALYHATKHFYLAVQGSFSILVLQAGLLMALYELGHGIYPAAYLSIGACARYAHALGINVSGTVPTRGVLTLVEVEERRRIWWALVVLDRFVSIGCPGRPFATADSKLDDLLPADDAAWDEGIVRPDSFATLSSPMTGHMSKFALVCQAARLLGQVLNYLSNHVAGQNDVWMQLDRTLHSMLTAALNIDSPDYDQITFIYSALIALYTPWLSSNEGEKAESDYSWRARAVLQQITDRISANLIERQCFSGRDPEDMTPWGLYFAYQICGAHMRSSEKSQQGTEVVKSLREGFLAIDMRWDVAAPAAQKRAQFYSVSKKRRGVSTKAEQESQEWQRKSRTLDYIESSHDCRWAGASHAKIDEWGTKRSVAMSMAVLHGLAFADQEVGDRLTTIADRLPALQSKD
ncbi:hypothetical protein N7448_010085 [Penicillium atrosanguineum]|uniref:Xylanolytic transcriptional activator regulatory domain-containing protein n=1 Tax=Penicillium atrosanguineum TaxID=1132637 RepID=A0A9W9GFG9_9EURO|nr:hypothetical protein N7448_010085 [Penicillium atrosanguineum]KAJ5299181.1 hypothetical protein N7476_010738 [Penicillium atrosanguineum]